ncbi:hypothetical protein LWS69_01130 [Bordetella hinzii]|nr:hypothetical protein [Bordetella hinzii]
MGLILSGNDADHAQELTEAQVNHLRRLLAWMRCEYMLDEFMQRGFISGAAQCVQSGLTTPEDASRIVEERAAKINQVPAYVRQAVKMLTKAVHQHDAKTGVVEE